MSKNDRIRAIQQRLEAGEYASPAHEAIQFLLACLAAEALHIAGLQLEFARYRLEQETKP